MKIGNREFDVNNHAYVMGILNVTPDSFSDGGKFNDMDRALFHVEEMIAEGMDILDIGGESARPGYTAVLSVQEETDRVIPVIEAVKKRFDIPISLDTCKGAVAKAGIQAGTDLINDIWGFKWDGRMADIVAAHDVACCLMHNRRVMDYTDYLNDVVKDLDESVQMALNAGVKKEKIMVDPGIGFAKNLEQNLALMNHLELLHKWDFPILLGTSRKSMIGLTLDLPVTEREEGTIATSVMGLMKGCQFFRVHNVKGNARALQMAWAIMHS